MEIYFQPDFSSLLICLGAVALAASLFLSTVYSMRILKVARYSRRQRRLDGDAPSRCPSISVVVYDCDSAEALGRMLPEVLAQNYPVPFEVIVAIDGHSESADEIVSRLCVDHNNLRVTFVPEEAHALSRKKLALTLGIKAARHDYVLLTDANAIIPSYDWLLSFGRHFAAGKEVVIGHSRPVGEDGSTERAARAFSTLRDSVTYLSSAIAHKPYRAGAANFAFKRSLFFDNKGFASSVGYHHGEDDIFISQIATPHNTAVELAPQARLSIGCHNLKSFHRYNRLRHMFTGRFVSKCSRRFFACGSIAAWAWLAATVALGLIPWPNIFPVCVGLGLGIIWMTMVTISWKSASKALDIKIPAFTIPLMMLSRPLSTLLYRLRAKSSAQRNYTWSKP